MLIKSEVNDNSSQPVYYPSSVLVDRFMKLCLVNNRLHLATFLLTEWLNFVSFAINHKADRRSFSVSSQTKDSQ
jgi:hypothetical protein